MSSTKFLVVELHLRKIDLCDHVYVLNVGGYIGSSTRKEIEYAEKIGKPVEYLEPLEQIEGKESEMVGEPAPGTCIAGFLPKEGGDGQD